MDYTKLKIGYVPYSNNFQKPGDRRRFIYYATKRNLSYEIADPNKKYDIIILSQSADLSVWIKRPKDDTKIVYDFIDSYLAVPRNSLKGNLRGLAKFVFRRSKYPRLNHWKALEDMCKQSSAVVCSTDEQAKAISKFNNNVHVILDVHTSLTTSEKKDYKAGEIFNLVWEGLGFNVYSLSILKNVIARVQKKYRVNLHVVTDLEYKKYLGIFGKTKTEELLKKDFSNVTVYEWNEKTCAKIISECDLALIPIDMKDPLVRGKPENKLLIFWRIGVPAICSATPVYSRVMKKAGTPDMVCETEDEWVERIEACIQSEEKRRYAGQAGKKLAETDYNEESILKKWDTLFDSLYPKS